MLDKIKSHILGLKLWMESYAEKPQAMFMLFFISFIESSVFPLPPDILLVAIAIASPRLSIKAAALCTVGSVFGGAFGYFIGYSLMSTVGNSIVDFYHAQEVWKLIVDKYNSETGIWFLAIAAFTPVPYKISTIAAGATLMDFWTFILVSVIGRGARFFLVGGLFYFFGSTVKAYIDKYFDKLSIVLVIGIIAGFIALKFIL